MSEFKFACPVCGQHITCDSTKSGTKLDCPTCFQKIVVPAAPTAAGSKLILTAAQAQSRPVPLNGATAEAVAPPPSFAGKFSVAAIVVLVCVAGALFAFRGKIFNRPTQPVTVTTAHETNWTLNLAGVTIPDTPVAGRISGRVLDSARVTLQGGTLIIRQDRRGLPDVGVTISLFAREGGELAGKYINIETNHARAPTVVFRWKDDPPRPATKNTPADYALRLQFGAVTNSRLPGKIYFCALDAAKSWVAGTFEAEIRKPAPPKPHPPAPPKR